MQVNRPSVLKFAFVRRAQRSRRGVSILEVLFAIAVTTIGLLGAIAVFPVASAQARKGRISDAMAVAGMSAAHDFDVREMRKPCTWVAWNSSTGAWFSPWQSWQQFNEGDTTNGQNWFSGGVAFCIDPRFIAINNDSVPNRNAASRFPIVGSGPAGVGMGRISITGGFPQPPIPQPYDVSNPPALTVNGPIGTAVAEALFMFDDDLTFERPGDRSLPALQTMDHVSGVNLKRQSDGHMTWMATLVPKLDQMSTNAELYVLSIVVFYDRPLARVSDGFGTLSARSFGEQEVWVDSLPGSGLTGGEVVLGAASAEALNVKANDWVLLSGRTNTTNRPMFRWYRVVDADDEAIAAGPHGFQRHVTLFGQDWNASVLDPDPNLQRAVLVEGVVGVYEKTIRLDLTPSN